MSGRCSSTARSESVVDSSLPPTTPGTSQVRFTSTGTGPGDAPAAPLTPAPPGRTPTRPCAVRDHGYCRGPLPAPLAEPPARAASSSTSARAVARASASPAGGRRRGVARHLLHRRAGGGDHGAAGGHGLEHRQAEPLGPRREAEEVGAGVERPQGVGIDEADGVNPLAEPCQLAAEVLVPALGPGEDQVDVGVAEALEGGEEGREVLARLDGAGPVRHRRSLRALDRHHRAPEEPPDPPRRLRAPRPHRRGAGARRPAGLERGPRGAARRSRRPVRPVGFVDPEALRALYAGADALRLPEPRGGLRAGPCSRPWPRAPPSRPRPAPPPWRSPVTRGLATPSTSTGSPRRWTAVLDDDRRTEAARHGRSVEGHRALLVGPHRGGARGRAHRGGGMTAPCADEPVRVGVNLLWLVPGEVGGSEEYTVRLLAPWPTSTPPTSTSRCTSTADSALPTPRSPSGSAPWRTRRRHLQARRGGGVELARRSTRRDDMDVVHHAGGTMPAAAHRRRASSPSTTSSRSPTRSASAW